MIVIGREMLCILPNHLYTPFDTLTCLEFAAGLFSYCCITITLPFPCLIRFHETPAYLTFVVVQLCEDSYFETFVHPLLLNQVLVDNSIYGYLELVSRNCYWDPRAACNDQRTAFRL